jgi:hypothetical protein
MEIVSKCISCGKEEINTLNKKDNCGHIFIKFYRYESGEPCSHNACRSHYTHPCEVCGRKLSFDVGYVMASEF